MKNKKQFSGFMSLISEKYGVKISDPMIKMIWKTLELFPDDVCKKAFNHVIAYCRFYKDLMPDLLEQLEGSKGDKALRAWVKTIKAVRQIGNGESVQFDDSVIHSVIEAMGGWIQTGEWLQKDEKWVQKDFTALYWVAEKQKTHPPYLMGEYEENNQAQFPQFIKAPVKIYDDEDGQIKFLPDERPIRRVIENYQKQMLKSSQGH